MKKTEPIKQANRDRNWTPEMREHMREVCSGEKNGFFGKTHDPEARAVMSEKAKIRVKQLVPSRLAGQGLTAEDYLAAKNAGLKWCKVCRAFLPLSAFRDTQALCREHLVAAQRVYTLRRRGCTPERFDALLTEQNGCCAICGTNDSGSREWNVDHDHGTKIVRGLLCRGCNVALHKLERDLTWAAKAIAYLTQQTPRCGPEPRRSQPSADC